MDTDLHQLPIVSFKQNGRIQFNKAAVQTLELSKGKYIDFLQDEDEKETPCFYVTPHGGRLRITMDKNKSTLTFSVGICKTILSGKKSQQYLVAGQPTKETPKSKPIYGLLPRVSKDPR